MTRRWRARSLRVRLTLWYAGVLAVVLVVYAIGVFLFLRHSLSSALDRELRDDFEVAERMLDRDGPNGVRWRVELEHEEGDASEGGRWVEVWSRDGRLLHGTGGPSSAGSAPPLPRPRGTMLVRRRPIYPVTVPSASSPRRMICAACPS